MRHFRNPAPPKCLRRVLKVIWGLQAESPNIPTESLAPSNDWSLFQRKTQGGGELRGGKPYHKAPPQKRFWTPPLMIRFPPLCSRNVILLRGNGHRPDKSHFLRPPKLGLEGALYSPFPPPKKIVRYVLPPPPFANFLLFRTGGKCPRRGFAPDKRLHPR